MTMSRRQLLLALATSSADAGVLASAVGLEETAVAAYEAALTSGHLDPATAKTARLLQGHEEAHRDRLKELLGGTAPHPVSANLLAPVKKATSQRQLLAALLKLEAAIVSAHYDAVGRLTEPSGLEALGEIMASEGQHLVVLRTALGQPPVPNAFEPPKAAS
jgi:rubrerythrin